MSLLHFIDNGRPEFWQGALFGIAVGAVFAQFTKRFLMGAFFKAAGKASRIAGRSVGRLRVG